MNEAKTTVPKAHIALRVKNLGRSLDFYRKLFAAEPVKLRRAYAKFDLAEPPLNFALNESPTDESSANGPQTLSHLGIQVSSTEEVLKLRERWRRAGLDTRDEMHTECCYAVQDKTWARDPDGNEWEAFVVLEDQLPERAAESSPCCPPACCAPAAAQNES